MNFHTLLAFASLRSELAARVFSFFWLPIDFTSPNRRKIGQIHVFFRGQMSGKSDKFTCFLENKWAENRTNSRFFQRTNERKIGQIHVFWVSTIVRGQNSENHSIWKFFREQKVLNFTIFSEDKWAENRTNSRFFQRTNERKIGQIHVFVRGQMSGKSDKFTFFSEDK